MTTKRRYSNSYIQQFAKCPLSAHYKYDLHLRPADGDSHDLAFGRAFGRGLEVLYVKGDLDKAKAAFREECPPAPAHELAKTVDNGLFALDKYVECYDWDKNWRVLTTEDMDATEDGFVVKLDLVVEDVKTGSIIGIDHKTTGSYLDYKYFGKFNPNSQVTQYYRYITEKYGHCDGFIINAIRFAFLKRSSKDRSAGFNVEFERSVFQRTEQQVAQEQESKNYWVERIEEAQQHQRWGMNTAQCFLCEFQSACGAGWDWEHDAELILGTYRQVCEKFVLDGNFHCNLDLGHDGEHQHLLAAPQDSAIEVEI